MDSETGTEIERQGEKAKEKHRHGDKDWGQGQIYRQTWTEGARTKIWKGTEGQGWKDRDGRTGIESMRKGQRNTDSDSGTWTWSGTERQGHDHRDWDERQEQVQTEGHQ